MKKKEYFKEIFQKGESRTSSLAKVLMYNNPPGSN
jgi:hypothetical protein